MNDSKKLIIEIRTTIHHEDSLFAQRANFFLLSQTVFFAAYSQIMDNNSFFQQILIVLGIFTATIWMIVAFRNIKLIIKLRDFEESNLKEIYSESWEKNRMPKVGCNLLSSNNLIGILFPVLFLTCWIFIWLFNP